MTSASDVAADEDWWTATLGEDGAPRRPLREEIITIAQLADLPPSEPLIDGVLSRRSRIIVAGRHSTCKTFLSIDWCACIATGKPWQSHPVEQGRVLYIAAEGSHGLHSRLAAWQEAWKTPIPGDMFDILPRAVNLFRKAEEIAQLVEIVQDGQYMFVAVDTLNRNSAGADSNGTQDMSRVIESLDAICRATTGGSVLVVAHTDATDSKTRGSTSIEDDLDIVYRVRAEDGGVIRLWRDKNKDGPRDDDRRLRLVQVGDSCVLESHTEPLYSAELPTNQARLLTALRDDYTVTGASTGTLVDATGIGKSSASAALNRLHVEGLVDNIGTSQRAHWKATTVHAASNPASNPIGRDRPMPSNAEQVETTLTVQRVQSASNAPSNQQASSSNASRGSSKSPDVGRPETVDVDQC